jgi:hypothetical protein
MSGGRGLSGSILRSPTTRTKELLVTLSAKEEIMNSIRSISYSLRSLQRLPSSSSSTGKKFRSQVNIKPRTRTAPLAVADPWTEVKDEASGLTYWWNQETDETTHVGASKPTLVSNNSPTPAQVPPPQEQQGSLMSGLGGMVAQGFAFGVGSSIARSAVNSLFGSESDGGGGDDDIVEL